MKVMIIGNVPSELAGARRHFLRALIERGHEVVAAAPDLFGSEAQDALEEIGVACTQFPLSRTGLNPIQEVRTYRALRSLIRTHRPDLVLAMTIKPVIWGMLAAAGEGVPRRFSHITGLGYAFTGSRSGKRALVGGIVERLYRRALGKADLVFFENEDDRDLFVERNLVPGPQNTRILDGSGIDLAHFSPRPWPEGPMRFLFTGRLLASKGIPELVTAMSGVANDYPDVRLAIAGPADDNPDALSGQIIAAWNRMPGIEFLGNLDDVRSELAKAHVFILPSHREGLPRSTMEAMATGRAVITTDAPGCRRTVAQGDNGLLVPVNDPEALEVAMRWMIENPDKAHVMGKRSIDLVQARYSIQHVNEQLIEAMGL